MFGRATITLGIGPNSSFGSEPLGMSDTSFCRLDTLSHPANGVKALKGILSQVRINTIVNTTRLSVSR